MNASVIEELDVQAGDNAGATIDVSNKPVFSVGSDYNNDVVLRCDVAEPVKLQIDTLKGNRRVQLLEGDAALNDSSLVLDEYNPLPPQSVIEFGSVRFCIAEQQCDQPESIGLDDVNAQHTVGRKQPIAAAAVLSGVVLLGLMGIFDAWLPGSDDSPKPPSLEELLAEQGLGHLIIQASKDDSNVQILKGRVETHDSLRQVQQLVASLQSRQGVSIDVQNDAALTEAMQDIYRNHGVSAEISIKGIGHVLARTEGVDEETLLSIEQALQADLPNLQNLEASNTPPVDPPPGSGEKIDPDKEVEAVVAGEISYLITRDQSRYFVGAVLPSGHTIKSISEGTVVLSRQGEETQLNF